MGHYQSQTYPPVGTALPETLRVCDAVPAVLRDSDAGVAGAVVTAGRPLVEIDAMLAQ